MNTQSPEQSPLGKGSAYADQYDASLLFPLPRSTKRAEIGLMGALPFVGADLWTAYEVSWLNLKGKPQVALAHITVPCESSHIVESKSLKLYLNSFNNTRFDNAGEVLGHLRRDISAGIWHGGPVQASAGVTLLGTDHFHMQKVQELEGLCIDRLDLECSHYTPAPQLLHAVQDQKPVSECLVSHLLKSNCLVTGQPDWGSVQVAYSGPQIDQTGLLQYVVSFRNHNEFHEQCVERMYTDIWQRCKPTKLSVYARYTRRGGLDINPWRSSHPQTPPANVRTARQ